MKKQQPVIILLLMIFAIAIGFTPVIADNNGLVQNEKDPVLKLTEAEVKKVNDPGFLKYVNQALKLKKRELSTFKVFISYDPDRKEYLKGLTQKLETEDIYFYRYTNLISIQAEAGVLAELLTEKAVLTIETDEVSYPFSPGK